MENTGISWAHSSFNIVWGCTELSPACDRCYARTLSERWGFDVWGKDKPRRPMSEHYWNDPLRWQKKARLTGTRRRVFCSSMADVFEDHPDVAKARERLWPLIERTPDLDWMLLTKRTALMTKFTPDSWKSGWPSNVWAGTTAEDQKWYDHRMPLLMKVPAKIHWFSLEPLLGQIDLRLDSITGKKPDWMIVGGESGHGARPMHREWPLSIKDQCRAHGLAFFMKQKGNVMAKELGCKDSKGSDPSEWPAEFRVQEFPQVA